MTEALIGRLERVDLRTIWTSESSDFTPWLALPENLAALSEAMEIDLEFEGREKPVGRFSADILCKELGTDRWVLIENQLERTDHCHLGQLMPNVDPDDETDWPRQHQWLADGLNAMHTGFSQRVRNLDADLWRADGERSCRGGGTINRHPFVFLKLRARPNASARVIRQGWPDGRRRYQISASICSESTLQVPWYLRATFKPNSRPLTY